MKNKNSKIKKTKSARVSRRVKSVKKPVKAKNGKLSSSKTANRKDYNLAKIKVIGIGGCGGNAVSRMYDDFPRGVDLIVVNTDLQDIERAQAKKKIYIGKNLTRGLGTGMNPELGAQAAEENQIEISEALEGTDMVFLTAGFGGGTGTGALPVIAKIAKEMGILTIAIVTKPFSFEGYERQRIAEEGIMKTKDKVDTLITIKNDQIFSIINKNTSLIKAFEVIDEVLKSSVEGIADLIMSAGIINVDFADVKAIMQNAGSAIIGIGVASGADRAQSAANSAIGSPLLELSIEGARGILFSISGRSDLKMSEVNEVARLISEQVDHSAKIIFGAHTDRKLKKGELKVILVATGFDGGFKGREHGVMPTLFVNEPLSNSVSALEENKVDKINKKKKEKEEVKEDVWDIPTFLRKKRKN